MATSVVPLPVCGQVAEIGDPGRLYLGCREQLTTMSGSADSHMLKIQSDRVHQRRTFTTRKPLSEWTAVKSFHHMY